MTNLDRAVLEIQSAISRLSGVARKIQQLAPSPPIDAVESTPEPIPDHDISPEHQALHERALAVLQTAKRPCRARELQRRMKKLQGHAPKARLLYQSLEYRRTKFKDIARLPGGFWLMA
jgi:hypothetical protein